MIVLRFIGSIIGIITLLIMMVAFVPMLGWLNWVNIPVATVGMIFSSIGNSTAGKTMCGISIGVGTVRLIWGGGVL